MFFPLPNRPHQVRLDPVRQALERALIEADQEERPGLRRALEILDGFGPTSGPVDPEWARKVLATAGVDPRTAEVKAVRELRSAHQGLSLKEAAGLVRTLIDQGN
ncbi:hypothetical protein [Kitasatospora sp. GAS204B]|uniref:hypothetical protein n=1 Tax=unclassified Kitasatospora TaxID=2633591 RepID=UPI002474A523|nr:hypothetical protein [Kitasatospora sp. GAS204B]MDH6121974.1 hypothetical protein [Kitasatospora sp. GAS204B]